MIGPLVAAAGFALFAVASMRGDYWTTFFPAIVVLGLSMAITVAPLTTVVMNAAGQDRAGAASGVNNAVARVAGVLAIAVLGIVMVRVFGWRLDHSLVHIPLPAGVQGEIESNQIKPAGVQAPAGLDSVTRDAVSQSVKNAFVFGFRIVMWICAALSLTGASIAWRMIPLRSSDERVVTATINSPAARRR